MTQRMPLRYGLVIVLLLIAAVGQMASVGAAVIPIDTTYPGGITAAVSAAGSGGTVILAPGTYEEHAISVGNSVTIEANASLGGNEDNTIIDAQHLDRIFSVAGSYTLVIDNLTLENGQVPSGFSGGNGGAVDAGNGGSVTVTSSSITACQAGDATGSPGNGGDGGAIFATGGVSVTSSSITACRAGDARNNGGNGGDGGAIFAAGSVSVTSSTFTGCRAGDASGSPGHNGNGGDGGAIFTQTGTVSITNATITGCRAGDAVFGPGIDGSGGAITTHGGQITFSRLLDNSAHGGANEISGPVTATDDWWGSNNGPSPSSDFNNGASAGTWLVLGATASPLSLTAAQASQITANLTFNNTGSNLASFGTVPDGIPVAFGLVSDSGTFSPVTGSTSAGINMTEFSPSSAGLANVSITVDSQTVYMDFTVTAAPTATPTSFSSGGGAARLDYWANTGGSSEPGYTGPAVTPIMKNPTMAPTVQPSVVHTLEPSYPSTTLPPLPTNTPRAGLDILPVLGALGLCCGIFFLFRKKGN